MNKIGLYIISLCTIASIAFGQGSWTEQTSGTIQSLYGVSFTDANTGTAVGYLGTILRTTDGGASWTKLTSGTTKTLYTIYFIDANNGTVVGQDRTTLHTTDGGANWTSQASVSSSEHLYGVSFINANIGTSVGASGTIRRTTDGGESWTYQTSGVTAKLSGVSFTDANIGTVVGAWSGGSGTILRTTNGGITWTNQISGTVSDLNSVYFTDGNTGTAVGSNGTILRTINGGTVWKIQSSGTTNSLYSVRFTDTNNGIVVGASGIILRTTDGGTTWLNQSSGTSKSLNAVGFIDANTGWVVGNDGTILKYSESSSDVNIEFSANKTSGTVPLTVQFSDLTTGSPTSWKWFFGDGDTSVAQHPIHTYFTPGVYDVSLAAANNTSSKVLFKTKYITVNPPGDVYEPNDSLSIATPIQYGDSIIASIIPDKDLDFFKFLGYAGDSILIEEISQIEANGSGIDGRITIYDHTGTQLVTIDDGLTSEILGLKLLNTGTYFIRFSYWNVPDASFSAKIQQRPLKKNLSTMLSSTTGIYALTLKKISSSNNQMTAAFSATPMNGIAPLTVQFNDQSLGNPIAWKWQFGDGVSSTVHHPSHTYLSPGKYSVTLEASNADASDVLTKNDYITVVATGSGVGGNSFANAGVLNHTDSLYQQFPASDSWQYYKIILPSDGFFEVRVHQNGTDIVGYDQFRLYDADTTNIRVWGSNSNGIFNLKFFARQGMYYLRFNHNSAVSDLAYSIVTKFSDVITPSEPEPNDIALQANPLICNGPGLVGHLGYSGNGDVDVVDFWKIMIPNDGYVEIHVLMDSLDAKGNRINFDLNLYDVDSASYVSWDDSDDDRHLNVSKWLTTGIYFIRLNKAAGEAGVYEIYAKMHAALSVNDPEPNNSPATASSLSFATMTEGHLGFYGGGKTDEVDHWKFTTPNADSVYVHIISDSTIEINIDIFDVDGINFIPVARQNTTKSYSRTGFKSTSSTQYLVKLFRSSGNAGTYKIVVNNSWLLDFTAPLPPKNFTVTPSGSGKFDLSWNDNAESDIAGYKIYYSVSNAPDFSGTGALEGSSPILVGKVNTFSITGLENDRLYRFAITAIDDAKNESGFSMLRFAQSGSTSAWTLQNSGIQSALNSASFVDQYTGWVVGDSAIALKTIDGGATWKILTTPLPKNENFFRVHFVDHNYGYAIGGTFGLCKILRTSDGGATWTSLTSSVAARPIGLFFIDRMRGWVVGDNGMVLNTADGGITWNQITLSTSNHLSTVVFSDAINGWICGQYGTLFNTTDGGKTWKSSAGGDPYNNVSLFGPIDFIDPMNGWITMENGPFIHTTNGGITWLRDSIPTKNYMWGMDFVDAENGFAVGRNGDIFRTIDGGYTWKQESSGISTGLYSVVVLGKSTAWAVGANGVILKYNVNAMPHLIPVPRILSIWDIPNDNGKQVYVKWHSGLEAASSGIRSFAIWRYNSDSSLWVNVKENIQSLNDTVFTTIAPTVYDSTIVNGIHYSLFKISSHGMDPIQYSLSAPDSGYSVDNLIPAIPDSITGSIINSLLSLRWRGTSDQDLRYFSIYRDTIPNFDVRNKKPFAVTMNNYWTDSSVVKGKKYYYRIASVDWSGNRSAYSEELAFTVTSVKENKSLPTAFALNQNYPNPFNPTTTIRFALPVSSHITIKIYSAIGQLVETLEDGLKETGWYSLTWQPRTSSGMYFCRIVAVSTEEPRWQFTDTKKLLFIK